MERKHKIFISAFACDPTIGSEPGVGWHWVLELSKYFELWVLTVEQDHGSIQEKITAYLKKYPEDDHGIHFIYYDLSMPFIWMKKNIMTMRFYYILWQWKVNGIIKKVMETNDINVFHLLTYGNMIWPISKFGQTKHFIWGPTGGMDIIEQEYTCHYSWKSRMFEALRRIIVRLQCRLSSFINRCKNADLILCKAESSLKCIPEIYRNKAMLFTDVAMESSEKKTVVVGKYDDSKIHFISVGHMDSWRGFDLLIEAFVQAFEVRNDITLHILGWGTEQMHIKKQIQRLHAKEYIQMFGQVSMEEYEKLMQQCDVVVNSCLKEGGVTNAFDCMTWGKPLLCIDTGGYTRNFNEKCALILQRVSSRKQMVAELERGILTMCNEEVRKLYSKEISNRGTQFQWEEKGKEIAELFSSYIERWEN